MDPDPDPYPLVRGTDPGIRIRTIMSRIPNTASLYILFQRASPSPPLPQKKSYTETESPNFSHKFLNFKIHFSSEMVGEQDTSTGLPLSTNITFLQNSQEALQQISLNAICVNQVIFSFLTKKIYFTWDHVKKWEFYLSFSERFHGYVFWVSFSEQWSIRLGRLSNMIIFLSWKTAMQPHNCTSQLLFYTSITVTVISLRSIQLKNIIRPRKIIKQTAYNTKYLYMWSTTVYVPSLELGLPHPLSRKRVCPTPRTKGWGGTLACG